MGKRMACGLCMDGWLLVDDMSGKNRKEEKKGKEKENKRVKQMGTEKKKENKYRKQSSVGDGG